MLFDSTPFDLSSMFNTNTNGGNNGTGFVWPSGFTPEDPPALLPSTSLDNPFELTLGHTLPGMTDDRLINALERQTAFIEGDPGAEDLELFYYRLVSSGVGSRLTPVRANRDASGHQPYRPQVATSLCAISLRNGAPTSVGYCVRPPFAVAI